MKITKSAVILLAMVLLTAAQSSEKPAKKEISNTYTASCLVKVTTDPAVLPGDIIAIEYLMHSSGVAGKAASEVLKISPDIASQLFEIEGIESIYPDSAGGVNPSKSAARIFCRAGLTPPYVCLPIIFVGRGLPRRNNDDTMELCQIIFELNSKGVIISLLM
jgi:hypothetical protein